MINTFLSAGKVAFGVSVAALFGLIGVHQASALIQPVFNTAATQHASTTIPLGTVTLVSQTGDETWYRGTNRINYKVIWTASSSPSAYVSVSLVPVTGNVSASYPLVSHPVPVAKKKVSIDAGILKNVPYGKYNVQLVLKRLVIASNKISYATTSTVMKSVGVVSVVEHQDPTINITSPDAGDRWAAGSKQKITWTANFIKGNSKVDPLYPDIKFIPTYGIATSTLDVSKFSSSDKSILAKLSPVDVQALSKLPKNKLALLDPKTVATIPGISPPGIELLSKLSPPGFGILKAFDPLQITGVVNTILLKPVKVLISIDPISKAIFSGLGLGGSEAPPEVHATIYLIPITSAVGPAPIKLDKTTIESTKDTITIPKSVAAGQYRVKIEAILKNTTIVGVSPIITVTNTNTVQPTASVWDGVMAAFGLK